MWLISKALYELTELVAAAAQTRGVPFVHTALPISLLNRGRTTVFGRFAVMGSADSEESALPV